MTNRRRPRRHNELLETITSNPLAPRHGNGRHSGDDPLRHRRSLAAAAVEQHLAGYRLHVHFLGTRPNGLDEPTFHHGREGTLAPWNPTQKLVVRGVYRHVRNPMIVGVFCILLGETILFDSWQLFCWFGFVVLVNLIYIPLSEEPGLAKQFGDDYLLYKKNVPRSILMFTPWEGLSDPAEVKQEGDRHE